MKKDITKISSSNRKKYLKRQKIATVEPLLEDQFTSGKLLGKSTIDTHISWLILSTLCLIS